MPAGGSVQRDMAEQDTFFRRRALAGAGASYSAGAVLPVLLSLLVGMIAAAAEGEGYADAVWFRYAAYLLPQLSFAAAALFFFRRTRVKAGSVYRGCKWYFFPVMLCMQFGLTFAVSRLGDLFLAFLEGIGYEAPVSLLPPLDGWYLLPALLIIALLPAFFEETLLRGILAGSMAEAGWGEAACVVVSGALFALFHGNPAQTVYQFVCGMCFALAALRAGSILPAMAAHFCNNAAVLILTATGYGEEGGWTMAPAADIAVTVLAALCFAASLTFFLLPRRKEERPRTWAMPHKGAFFLSAGVGIAVCAVQWIVTLVTGFLHG